MKIRLSWPGQHCAKFDVLGIKTRQDDILQLYWRILQRRTRRSTLSGRTPAKFDHNVDYLHGVVNPIRAICGKDHSFNPLLDRSGKYANRPAICGI